MAYVPMNRARAQIICTRPQDYAPARLRQAARYLLDKRDATEEEQRLASDAIEWRGASGTSRSKLPLKLAMLLPRKSWLMKVSAAQAEGEGVTRHDAR